jgi:hypothetical protein
VVAEYAPDKTEPQSREVIRAWVKTGMLAVEEYTDPIRRKATKGLRVMETIMTCAFGSVPSAHQERRGFAPLMAAL